MKHIEQRFSTGLGNVSNISAGVLKPHLFLESVIDSFRIAANLLFAKVFYAAFFGDILALLVEELFVPTLLTSI